MEKIRVRLAPSPTGPLHIGTARTALFNFLFSHHKKGEFILRFENTDESRSTKEFEKNITENLKWLGLDWDEGPFFQMDRLEIYKKYAAKLVKNGFAEEIDGMVLFKAKNSLEKLNIPFQVATKITDKEHHKELDVEKDKNSYLLKNIGQDLIHGPISGLVSDTVLLRSSGMPTFHLAVVVDDEKMKISHVIRGDDHFSNTPLHIILQKALGFVTPKYAHLPLILNPDKSKMSKRSGEVDVAKYREEGYLPEALINFLALLGSSPKKEKATFTLEELISQFIIARVQKSPAIFDQEKLDSLNGIYIRQMPQEKLDKILRENFYPKTSEKTLDLTKALQTRIIKLSEVSEMSKFFFSEPVIKKEVLIFKKSDAAKTKTGLQKALDALEKAEDTDWQAIDNLNKILQNVVKENNLSNGDIFWPVRAALSGSRQSPSPTELLQILGKEKSLVRIRKAIDKLE